MSLNSITFTVGGLFAGNEARIVAAQTHDPNNLINIPIYSNVGGTTQLPNPFTLGSNGSISFYASQTSSQLGIIVSPKE